MSSEQEKNLIKGKILCRAHARLTAELLDVFGAFAFSSLVLGRAGRASAPRPGGRGMGRLLPPSTEPLLVSIPNPD